MNRENIEKVRDALLLLAKTGECPTVPGNGPLGFAMQFAFHRKGAIPSLEQKPLCQAAGCIIGWTNILCEEEGRFYSHDAAAAHLGISERTAKALFFPEIARSYSDVRPEDAAEALTALLEIGEPVWPKHLYKNES